jgi:hypothetical protein
MTLSSSGLRNLTKHCPKALTYYEEHRPYPREVYGPGIAAHAVMQAVGESVIRTGGQPTTNGIANICDSVVHTLATAGRSYGDEPEPPIPIEAALVGVKIARDYLLHHDFPVGEELRVEVGLAVDEDWRPVPYRSPSAFWRGILDVLWIEHFEGDEYSAGGDVLVIRDWKSAWTTNQEETMSLQMRGYALLALANYEAQQGKLPSSIRIEVVSLRTGTTYSTEIPLDNTDTMNEWRRDLSVAIRAARVLPRKAIPGPRCLGCPYVLGCEDAGKWWLEWCPDATTPEEMARTYACLCALRDAMAHPLRAACDHGSIAIAGGTVGYHRSVSHRPREGAALELAARWYRAEDRSEWEAKNPYLVSLLDALGLGAGNLKRLIKQLTPLRKKADKARNQDLRVELEDTSFLTVYGVEFGIVPDGIEVNCDGDLAAQTMEEES